MPIDGNILVTYGGVAKKIRKGEFFFQEGTMPYYYYQIVEGNVKVYSSNESGKKLIQGTFTDGQSFGEPALLLDRPYPSTAEATANTVIIKIRKEGFLNILKDFPEITGHFLSCFAERIYDKSISAQILSGCTPEEKIALFFKKLLHDKIIDQHHPIPYTRQQIADFTNLRTETVIRTLIRMAKEEKIAIKDHKIFLNQWS